MIGEASNSIQLLLEYIISVKTQTKSVFGKSINKLEKDLDLNGAHNWQYKSLTESYEQQSTDKMKRRLNYLENLKIQFGIDSSTEKYITEAVRTRNGEVHVKWNEADYDLLQYYIENQERVKPNIFIPDVVKILKSLYGEA